jgi:long-chain fatty acid transport protein
MNPVTPFPLRKRFLVSNASHPASGDARLNPSPGSIFKIALLLITLLLLARPDSATALGFRVPNQDAAAIARANAFVATADNPSALYYNPAGITQLEGHQVQIGMHNLSVNSRFRSPTGVRAKTKGSFQSVPQLYYTYSPENHPLSYGLGVYVPYGLGIRWEEANPFRSLAVEGKLLYTSINPTVAWKVNDKLSIGGGLTINYAKVDLRQGLVSAAVFDEFRFQGDDMDFGYIAGIRWQPIEKLAFGVKYRSGTTMNLEGDSIHRPISAPERTNLRAPLPQFVVVGVSYRPTPKWNFEVNVDWTDWDALDTLTVDRSVSADLPLAFNWESSFLYHFGITRQLGKGYYASCGYFFSENSTTELSFSPLVPDQNLHVGSLGIGRNGEKWTWAVAGQFITGPARNVNTPAVNPFTGQSPNGDYKFENYSLNFSVGRKF